MKTPRLVRSICFGAALLATALTANAHPYASGVTNLNGNGTLGGTIQYRINEPCTNVYVLFYPGAVSNNLGMNGSYTPTPANGACVGVHTFVLPTNYTGYAIYCYNTGTGTPHWISPANGANNPGNGTNAGTNILIDFNGPRGVVVNKNPSSPYFGTIYVLNASPGTDGTGRHTGKGIYALNADYTDAFNFGSNAAPSSAQWGSSTTYAPYKAFVGPDDALYVADSDTSTLGAGVVMCAPDLSAATNLFPYNNTVSEGTGNYMNVQACAATGSYAAGNLVLYTMEWDRAPFQSFWQYEFYTTPGVPLPLPWNLANSPNTLASSGTCPNVYGKGNPNSPDIGAGINSVNTVVGDFTLAPDGKFFSVEERTTATGGNVAMYVYDSVTNGNCFLWDSLDQNGGSVDPFCTVFSLAISPDDQFLAMGANSSAATGGSAANAGAIEYCLLNYTNANGVSGLPNLSSLTTFKFNTAVNEAMRGVAFDKADNVYGVSGTSSDTVREFTLGFTSETIYSNDYTGTNGSFQVLFPGLTINATTPVATEGYGTPTYGVVTLTRSGPSVSQPLTVNYTLSGTATNGTQYTAASPLSVTFPANVTTEQILITNVESTSVPLPTLNVVVTVTPNPSQFAIEGNASATVYLANEGPQELFISGTGASTMYRGLPNDFVSFTLTRWGDTNVAYTLPASGINLAGTAGFGTNRDYDSGPQPVNFLVFPTPGAGSGIPINKGDVTDTFEVGSPLPHGSYTGTQTIVASIISGTSPEGTNFTGLANTATASLLDNLPPQPETVVLWQDELTSQADSTNWTGVFSQNDTNTAPKPVVFSNWNYNGSSPLCPQNCFADFGYPATIATPPDASYDGLDVPPNGSTYVLRVTANKGGGSSAACGINLYPQNCPVLQGNYAVRFNMNLVRGCNALGGSEYCVFGINHYGTNANWILDNAAQSNNPSLYFSFTNSDGIWFSIISDPLQFGNIGASPNTYPSDYIMCTATNGNGANKFFPSTGYWPLNGASSTSFINVFKQTVDYTSYNYDISNAFGYPLVGVPANQSGWYGGYDGNGVASCAAAGSLPTNGSWTDVEIRQSNSVVTLFLNGTTIFTYTNTTPFTNGLPMLGYYDPYAGEGAGGGVYYSDIRAVELGPEFAPAPVNATINVGANYTSTIGAIGTGPFTNVWYASVGNVPLFTNTVASGPDSGSYTFVSPSATTQYYVVVSDVSGSVTSSVVTLTVNQPPTITTPPSNLTVYSGATAKFTVTATGTPAPAYQWTSNTVNLANGGIVSGATTSALTLAGVTVGLNGKTYGVIVTNTLGKITNSGAVLTVMPPNQSFISSFLAAANGVKIGFYTTLGDTNDTTNSFYVQSSTNLSSPVDYGFTNLTSPAPTITVTGGTNFSVTIPTNSVDQTRYYRILHKPY